MTSYLEKKSTDRDVFILSVFTVVILFTPYFLYGEINIFEVGLYLPGINALLHGLVPFRDFFHLRGPFELYMPAFLMKVFGINVATLSGYFYAGTVLTLILCVFLAKEIYRTRLILYLMVPVLIARTFPRVVFTYWGGMRFAFGIFFLYCIIRHFKTEKGIWMFWAGLAAALGAWTSIEIGVCAVGAIITTLFFKYILQPQEKARTLSTLLVFLAGLGAISIPYGLYLIKEGALFPFIDSIYAVVIHKEAIFNQHMVSQIPSNPAEALKAMVFPFGKNFRHMTPAYLYLFLLGYLINRVKTRKMTKIDWGVMCIGVYGIIMYNTSFRGIWAAQFEMALQPEKILLFFLLEEVYFYLKLKKASFHEKFKIFAVNFLILGLITSSIGYSLARFNHRFFAYKYLRDKLWHQNSDGDDTPEKKYPRRLSVTRANGMFVSERQAVELETLTDFFAKNTLPQDAILMFPEIGAYNFFIDRPFVGRFPIPTFSWFNKKWYKEFITDLEETMPKYVVVLETLGDDWQKVYLSNPENVAKYNAVLEFVSRYYILDKKTPLSLIFKLKNKS